MKEQIEKFIGVHFKVGACNLSCSYCYIGQHRNKLVDIPYSIQDIKKAFSVKRLGGTCFINICSDGETLINPKMPAIIEAFLQEGHYVLVVTNAVLTNRLLECINCDADVKRLFFKVSFHYEEMKRKGILDTFYNNLDIIKKSPCSFTVEYITCDETYASIDEFKKECIEKMGALPHLNMPRDERACNLGVLSKDTWKQYVDKWDNADFKSEFWLFRKQVFGKKYKEFCYAGQRSIWVNMENGFSYQCYDLPPLQDFMGEIDKPVKWLAVGNNCPQAHCYVAYSHMTLGTVEFQNCVSYKPTYDVIRNRVCIDGTEWIKDTYKEIFRKGVKGSKLSRIEEALINVKNRHLKWNERGKGLK